MSKHCPFALSLRYKKERPFDKLRASGEKSISNPESPILIFDSGVGGLTILAALREKLPQAPVIYAADFAGLPYGTKSEAEVAARVCGLLGRMAERYQPRLICIATDFGKYDEHAVKQMNRNIALIRYRRFDSDLLLLDQLTSASAATTAPVSGTAAGSASKTTYKTITEQMKEAPQELLDLYHLLADYMLALGDDVDTRTTAFYIAFRRIKNFASVELRNQAKKLLVFVKVNPDTVQLEPGFTRDVRKIGHVGTGDLEISISSLEDFERCKPLLQQSYNLS